MSHGRTAWSPVAARLARRRFAVCVLRILPLEGLTRASFNLVFTTNAIANENHELSRKSPRTKESRGEESSCSFTTQGAAQMHVGPSTRQVCAAHLVCIRIGVGFGLRLLREVPKLETMEQKLSLRLERTMTVEADGNASIAVVYHLKVRDKSIRPSKPHLIRLRNNLSGCIVISTMLLCDVLKLNFWSLMKAVFDSDRGMRIPSNTPHTLRCRFIRYSPSQIKEKSSE